MLDKEYLQKAAELGNLVLESDFSIRLADAKAAYEADSARLEEYKRAAREYDDFAESVVNMLEITIFGSARGKGCGGCCIREV